MKWGCLGLVVIMFIGRIDAVLNGVTDEENPSKVARRRQYMERVARGRARAVSPNELIQAYVENEVAADLRFKGKWLRISGTVDSIGKDLLYNIYLTIDGGYDFRQIQVFFSDAQASRVAQIQKGMEVTIVGRCEGMLGNISLKSAVLK